MNNDKDATKMLQNNTDRMKNRNRNYFGHKNGNGQHQPTEKGKNMPEIKLGTEFGSFLSDSPKPENIKKHFGAKGPGPMSKNMPVTKPQNQQGQTTKQSQQKTNIQNGTKPQQKSQMQNVAKNQQRPQIENITKMQKSDKLKVIFLGGVGEIGKNMTLLEYGNDILVIDAGLSFPSEEMLGIDIVLPDFTYLKENASKVKGIVITHGHEDHIGAVAYVLKELNVPIYGSRLTLALLDNKFREHGITNVKAIATKPRSEVKIGCFTVEFVHVNHSIGGATALAITTPVGIVFHTGDFKIDFEPIDGEMIDLPRIAEIGKKGVLLMLGESTNIERPGYTESESVIGSRLDKVFQENTSRRLFVATFASNIYRVQQILELAQKHGRRVAVVGRSMINNLEAGTKVGCFHFPKELFIDVDKVPKIEDKNVLIMCTGSQGEPTAALSRLASGNFNRLEIGSNDTIILSSSPIPGNETMINRVVNNLYKKGSIVVCENVHASGHACCEELKTIHSLIKPKYFMPVHGEYRHLKKHAMLAEDLGMPAENIVIPEIGLVVEVSKNSIVPKGRVQSGEMLVDGLGIGDMDSVVLRDRKLLSEDGLVIVVLTINEGSGELEGEPYMITRGFVYTQEAEKLVEDAKALLMTEIKNIDFSGELDWNDIRTQIRKPLRNFFFKATKRNPMILPIINLSK